MILRLKNVVRYEESSWEKIYNPRQQFTRYYFKKTEQKFEMSACQMKRTDENLFKSHYAMLNLKQLAYYEDLVSHYNDSLRSTVMPQILPYYKTFNPKLLNKGKEPTNLHYKKSFAEVIPSEKRLSSIVEAM